MPTTASIVTDSPNKITIASFASNLTYGSEAFCDVISHEKFNWGLDDFDIIVN